MIATAVKKLTFFFNKNSNKI